MNRMERFAEPVARGMERGRRKSHILLIYTMRTHTATRKVFLQKAIKDFIRHYSTMSKPTLQRLTMNQWTSLIRALLAIQLLIVAP
jgi:hypothetical protein